jgi:hypothetical protein
LVLGRNGDFAAGSDFNTGFASSFETGASNTAANVGASTLKSGDLLTSSTATSIGLVTVRGGDNTTTTNATNGGDVTIRGGNVASTTGTPRTGNLLLQTPTPTGTNVSTGDITVSIGTPTGTGTQGQIKLIRAGLPATIGYVWTATNADGSGYWAASGGGGGTPGGATGAIQYNNAGAFAGDAPNFFWDSVNLRLGIGTNAPINAPLHIKGLGGRKTYFEETNAATANFFSFANTAGSVEHYFGMENSTGTNLFGSGDAYALSIGTVQNNNIAFHTNNVTTPRLKITSTDLQATIPIRTAAGSGGAPSYSFSADPDTGIFQSSGLNTIGFATGGGTRWEIFNSGNLRPAINNTYDLGETSFWVRDGYMQRNLYFKGSQDYAIRGGASTLPSGATIDFHMSVIGGSNGNLGTYTNDSTNGAGQLYFETGNASGTSVSKIALISLKTGNHQSPSNVTATGGVTITTGNNAGTGAGADSGDINLVVGTVTGAGTRGKVAFNARILDLTNAPLGTDWVPDSTGSRQLGSSSAYFSQMHAGQFRVYSSGALQGIILSSALPSGAPNAMVLYGQNSGSITLPVGMMTESSSGVTGTGTGNVNIETGNMTGAGGTVPTGTILLKTGATTNVLANGNTGGITIQTGNAIGSVSGNSGDILIQTGTSAAGTRGKISFFSPTIEFLAAASISATTADSTQFGTIAKPWSYLNANALTVVQGGSQHGQIWGGIATPSGLGAANGGISMFSLAAGKYAALFSFSGSSSSNVYVETGNASATNSGDILFQTGTAVGTRGKIAFNGRILDLLNAPLGTNWGPDTAGTRSLGDTANRFLNIFSNSIFTGSAVNIGGRMTNNVTTPSGVAAFGVNSVEASRATALHSENTGTASTPSGSVYVESGNATGSSSNSGDINVQTGTATGTRGKVAINARQLDVTNVTEGFGLPVWKKYTVSESAFTAASSTENIELFQLPAKATIHNVIIKHTTSFTGGTLTAFTLSVGVSGNLTKYASAYDVFQATGASNHQSTSAFDMENYSSATSIRLAATSSGDNVNNATAGTVEVYVLWGILP